MVSWEREGFQYRFRCSFAAPVRRPKTAEEKAAWLDLVVGLVGLEGAVEAAWLAAADSLGGPDQARRICNAYGDAMREAPAIYLAFAASEQIDRTVRDYASAMAAAWVRSHLKSYPRTKAALEGADWESEIASATHLAWQELGPDSPIKRSTRFRDMLPKQKDGRRQRAPGPPDYINVVGRILEGRKVEPPELAYAKFADREARESALQRGRDAGLPPREMEILKLFVENPTLKNREVADRLGISVGTVKQLKSRIKRTLDAA
jgi:RNA polymerase sigma factor (sigma-70 family)